MQLAGASLPIDAFQQVSPFAIAAVFVGIPYSITTCSFVRALMGSTHAATTAGFAGAPIKLDEQANPLHEIYLLNLFQTCVSFWEKV